MLASQKLCTLAKLDSTPLPALQTCPPCVGVVYGSHDVCTTFIKDLGFPDTDAMSNDALHACEQDTQ